MTNSLTPAQTLLKIQTLLRCAQGNADEFIRLLKASQLQSLSFSKVSTVEACQYRFYLQYILHLEPEPVPEYFIKGKLLHTIIASTYQRLSRRLPVEPLTHLRILNNLQDIEQRTHLVNAIQVHLQNLWQADEVLGIELPFAMLLADDLPPVIGVIDLLLRVEGHYVAIDHKSGHDFYPPDVLQMAIYRQWLYQEYHAEDCLFYYEHYRWVNNLARIRKPAFLRSPVDLPQDGWQSSLLRIRRAYNLMQRIRDGRSALRNGDCFRCPYRHVCHH